MYLSGRPAEMREIRELARRHRLYVVGDAAQAHGATYDGSPIAQWADMTCFSFYPGKNLGAYGDAGAIVTDDREWADAIRVFANHGRTGKYNHRVEGINSRLDGLQAAVLSVKLRHLEAWTERRRRCAELYAERLPSSVVTPARFEYGRAVYHLYVLRVDEEKRASLQQFLAKNGIQTGIHYPIALPFLEAYSHLGHVESDFPHALAASKQILSLPMFAELSEHQISYVAGRIHEFVGEDTSTND